MRTIPLRTMAPVLAALVLVLGAALTARALSIYDVPRITPEEVMARMRAGEKIVIVDVRSPGAYRAGKIRIKGDIRIAPDELEDRMFELPMGAEIVTYCT